jgi:hypothetical protein
LIDFERGFHVRQTSDLDYGSGRGRRPRGVAISGIRLESDQETNMTYRTILTVAVAALIFAVAAPAADISGKWTAQFDTQIGQQTYTYEFKVEGGKLTGKATSNLGSGAIVEGKVSGDDVTFVENLKYQEQELRIAYKGKIAGDEIKFTRTIAEGITEELVAKRAK